MINTGIETSGTPDGAPDIARPLMTKKDGIEFQTERLETPIRIRIQDPGPKRQMQAQVSISNYVRNKGPDSTLDAYLGSKKKRIQTATIIQ